MRLLVTAFCVLVGLAHVTALAQSPPVDLAALPAEIKGLKWQDVDMSAVAPIDRVRSFMLINDVLDELGAQMTAEADLMSMFIENNNLGDKFASLPPVADPAPLTFADAQKIAVALLRGPMAKSSYTTNLAGTSASVIPAYEQMYQSSCQRKWAAMADSRLRVRSMARFLQGAGKMDAFRAWVPGEIAAETKKYQAAQAQQAASNAAKQAQLNEKEREQIKRQDQQLAQMQQQAQQAAQQMQQAMCAAQQNALTPAQQAQAQANANAMAENGGGGYPGWYYGGMSNLGTTGWYGNGAYLGAAAAATDARFAGWHGGGFHR